MTWEFVAAALCFVVFCGIAGRLFSGPARRTAHAAPSAGPTPAAKGVALLSPGVPSSIGPATGPATGEATGEATGLALETTGPASADAAARSLPAARRSAHRKVRPVTRLAGKPRGIPRLVSTAPRGLKVLRALRPA